MKRAEILHNPNAGEGEVGKEKLINIVSNAGYQCHYSSTKDEGWEPDHVSKEDLVVIAGGDGTVRKVIAKLLDVAPPIGLIPLGTANNIAKTLGVEGDPQTVVDAWKDDVIKKYDVGRLYGLKKADFFLEGFGYGVFPRLMKEMKQIKEKLSDRPEENLKTALLLLHDIILKSKARYCKITIDGADYSGEFLLAEVMNIHSIGPNLQLAPFANPSDGCFEVILISERQRDEFATYVHNKIHGIEAPPIFNILKAKNLEIYWEGKLLHVDDEIIQLKESQDVKIRIQEGLLQFRVQKQE